MSQTFVDALSSFEVAPGKLAKFWSLPALERAGHGAISRLPVSLRIVLESLVRNCDGKRVREGDVLALAAWEPRGLRSAEVPFVVARVLLQDFTGVPLLVDLAAMRSATTRVASDPKVIEPLVPVDLVIDHSVQVDTSATSGAFLSNLSKEFDRNGQRYEFLKWGMGAFDGFRIVPPGIGICHQVNLEFLAPGVLHRDDVYYPDSLVGTDSHTTMINGLGIVGWGVGGIEAEAGMLGQPVYFLMPDVVGVNLSGALQDGVTATDLVLHVTELLRKAKVVGKFVEFHGEGASTLAVTERATIANMAPEYGATMGYFPIDEQTCKYLEATGRSPEQVEAFRRYYQAQGMFGIPRAGECDYTQVLSLDLSVVRPGVAGPKRPQDRIELPKLGETFKRLLAEAPPTGYGKTSPSPEGVGLAHGDVVIAAITSCTNTSNPSVMLAAGLLAKKAVEAGLKVAPHVKTSLAPGSRVVTEYLTRTGLQPYLDQLGFNLVGYGCTTCIGNSGPLDAHIEDLIVKHDLVTASVLSGNRNFEARVHQAVKANFLMSPPLVVAFALAGRVDLDVSTQPLGKGTDGRDVFLKDIWPSSAEVAAVMGAAFDADAYRRLYGSFTTDAGLWEKIHAPTGTTYNWDPASTYIREPPYFFADGAPDRGAVEVAEIRAARALAIFGDSITTDHISPAGAFKASTPAGKYLLENGVSAADFNSYGSRRGNHEVMVRGTFANVRIKNSMVPGVEGGFTVHQPDGVKTTIYDASLAYATEHVPLIVFAGHEYGTGSSRDWAAKGTRLLGVRAVVARSFERIHRSNLVGMGVLPCQFVDGTSAETLGLDGTEIFEITGIAGKLRPRMDATLVVQRLDGRRDEVPIHVRIDTPIEVDYYQHGGILPYVLRQLLARAAAV